LAVAIATTKNAMTESGCTTATESLEVSRIIMYTLEAVRVLKSGSQGAGASG